MFALLLIACQPPALPAPPVIAPEPAADTVRVETVDVIVVNFWDTEKPFGPRPRPVWTSCYVSFWSIDKRAALWCPLPRRWQHRGWVDAWGRTPYRTTTGWLFVAGDVVIFAPVLIVIQSDFDFEARFGDFKGRNVCD